jgi:hypothetical protein
MALTENDLLPDEEVLHSRAANLWVRPSEYGMSEFAFGGSQDAEAIGGKAHLTNYRVVFAAHSFNRLTGLHSIFLPNIRSARKGWTTITLATETQDYEVLMWFNRGFFDAIEDARQAFTRKDFRKLQSLVRDNLGTVSKGLQVNELAEVVNAAFLGVQAPLSALKEFLAPLLPEGRSAVLEVVTLLKQEAGRGKT